MPSSQAFSLALHGAPGEGGRYLISTSGQVQSPFMVNFKERYQTWLLYQGVIV